ncbi:phosphatidylethanolamine-binding protein 4-like [Motacilla alba alba]|uniref:phosphatidylethanolamine-binding protein 4-like n=1 Tax=Motacilla alba alba TaxID=1094192 RepID=UPI0018D4E857|nr:phosphatidylethanolamine-binding protein 4-like [Motacilla alba alba]
MKLLGAVLVALTLLLPGARGSEASRTCIFQTLSESDHEFCRGDLEVIYPEVGDVSCSYIPKCHGYRQKLSRDWAKPRVRYPWAKKNKKYVLVMVDPDCPNRENPRHRFWRHWLVTDILVSARGSLPSIRGGLESHGMQTPPEIIPEHPGRAGIPWDANSS